MDVDSSRKQIEGHAEKEFTTYFKRLIMAAACIMSDGTVLLKNGNRSLLLRSGLVER